MISEGVPVSGHDGVSLEVAKARAIPGRPLTKDDRARLRDLRDALRGWIAMGGFEPAEGDSFRSLGPRVRKALSTPLAKLEAPHAR